MAWSVWSQWAFLPTLVSSVPTLVAFKGGDSLSVCFNTVAVLFLWCVLPTKPTQWQKYAA